MIVSWALLIGLKVVEHLNVNKKVHDFFYCPHNMKKTLTIISLVFMTIGFVSAQDRPAWTIKTPNPENNTYIYVCENAIAGIEKDARNQAIARVFQSTAMRLGTPFDSEKVFEAVQRGTDVTTISRQYNLPIYKVCEYTERIGNNYKVYVLCQVAAVGNVAPQFDYAFNGCADTRQYNDWVALAKSAIIPGMGQMGKRHYAEGIFTFVGEVALVGGAIVTYNMGQEKMSKMTSGTLNYQDYSTTQNEYNTLRTCNTVLWGAAAVLYAYNLYRAFTATPRFKQSVAFTPSLIPTNEGITPTVGITLNF